jgi:hypothetical protein
MFPNRKRTRLRIPCHLQFLCGLILAATCSIAGHATVEPPQSGREQQPPAQVPDSQQQNQQSDRGQQQQDQMRQDQALGRASSDIISAEARAQADVWERARLQQLLRDNFRRHYKILRTNSDKLVQLTSDLQAHVESNTDAGLTRDTLAQAATAEKLAHEIRTTMAGRRLPRMKPSSPASSNAATSSIATMDARQLLLQRINACSALAATIKQATAEYLASDNEQAVSVNALKKAADKTQIDPHLVHIMNASARLERIAYDLRTLTQALPDTPAVSVSR